MKFVKPSFEILSPLSTFDVIPTLEMIETCGRVCYQSESGFNTYGKFIVDRIRDNHLTILEFGDMTVKFVVDRGISHELVRHRVASFAQESTRYCNYKDKDIEFIRPGAIVRKSPEYMILISNLIDSEIGYKQLMSMGLSPQVARSVLPNCIKTELVIKANFREWRHIFNMRTSKSAHPDMREIMSYLLQEAKNKIPYVFDDIPITLFEE